MASLLNLHFSAVSVNYCPYHATAAWPCNILALVLTDNGQDSDYYENLVEPQRLPVKAGHVYLMPHGLKMRFEESTERSVISLHFSLCLFPGIDVFAGSTQCVMRHDPEMVARFNTLLAGDDPDLKTALALKEEVMRFCLSCWPSGEPKVEGLDEYTRVFRHVREAGDAQLTVGDLAALAGQRQNVFSRNFKVRTGISPQQLIRDDLLNKISACLLVTGASIKETAAKLKFSSEFYMSRFFKKHTGLSPSEYRARSSHV